MVWTVVALQQVTDEAQNKVLEGGACFEKNYT